MMAEAAAGSGEDDQEVAADGLTQRQRFLQHKAKVEQEESSQLLEQNIAHLDPGVQEDARLDFQAGLIGTDLALTQKGQFEVNLANYPVEEDKEDLRDYFGRGFVDRDLQLTRRGELYTSDLDTVLAQGEDTWLEWVEMGAWDEHKERTGEDPFLKQVGGAVKSLVTEVVPEAVAYGSTGVMASTPFIKAADWVGSLGIPEGVPFLGAFTKMHEARKDAKLSVTELQRATRKELAAGAGAAARAGMENQVVLDKGRQLLQAKAQAGVTGAIAGLFDGGLGDADTAVLMALYDFENSKRILREASADEAAGALLSLAALGASEAERMEKAEFGIQTSQAARAGRSPEELAAIDKEAASYGMLGLDPSFPLTPAASLTAKGVRTAGLHLGKPLKIPGLGILGRTTLKSTDDAAKHLAALTARRAAMAKAAAREGAAPVVPGAGAGTAATPRPGLKTTGKRAARRTARQEIFARNLQRLDDEIYTAKRTLERHTARLGGVGALVKDGVRQASKNLADRFKQTRFGSWATEAGGWVDETLANLGRGKQAQFSGAVGSAFTGLGYFGLATGNPLGLLLLAPRTWSQQYRVLRGATQMINAAGAEFFRRRVTMPYWQRVSERVAENPWASGAASAIDVFARPLTAATKATGNVGSAIARSTAAEIPFSAMATGGEEGWLVEAAAEGIAFGVPGQLQGIIHGLGGAPARLKKHEFDLLAQNDVAEFRRNLSLGQREVFDLLDPVVKRQVGVYSALFPDVNFQFIPGSGGGAYREKTKTLIIDPESKNPLDVMLAHEIGHSLAARGMKEKIYTELVGPGGLLRDKDGNLTKEAKDFKREYENRLNRGRPPKEPRLELSDQRLAEEWFAEAVAPGLQKSQKLQKLVRRNKLITGLAEAVLPRVPFGKAMLLRRGVLLDKNGNLAKGQGAMVSANLSPALARLADAYLRSNAGSTFVPKGKRVPGTQKVVGGRTIEDLHRKAIYTREDMDRMEERNMIDYERNPDGSVKRDRFGRAKGLEPSVLAAQETTIGNIIRKVAEKYGVVPLTQKRGGDRFDKLTREQWDEILEEIRKTRLYNDHQIAAMRSAFRGMADNDGKAHRFQYHKALDTNEKTGKKRYKPKPQEDRVGSIYSIEVTKANNVIVKVIDMDALEERAIKASQSKDAPAMYRDNSADIMRDLMVLAKNHNKPDMKNVDVFGEERARFLNGVLGQLSKEHAFNNPTVKGGRPPIRSFRLDRANFVYNTNEDGLTFNHHQWVQGLMPEPADATTQQSDAARQDTINRLPEGDPSTGAEEGGLPAGERRGMGGDQGWVPEPDSPYPPATRPALIGLPQRIDLGDGRTVIFGPFQPARQAAEDYMAGAGLEYVPPTTYAKVDRERATRIADEYERMPHAPDDPEVREAYRAMIDETLAQYEEIKATGLVVEPMPRGTEPYGNPRNAILDVVENNHMWFFPTNEGFGGDAVSDVDVAENPLLEETGEVINGYRMTANDVFRVVHDYFGHVKEGNGFRAGGEENAWRAHSAMYSPKARRAMTSETRGQNSWVNYGPHGEFNRTASGADTEYAAQKTGLLPEWVTEEGAGDDIRRMPEGEGYPRDRRTLLAEERRDRGDGKEELTLKDLKRDLVALVAPSGVELARYQLVSNVGWVELDDIRRMPEQLDADHRAAEQAGNFEAGQALVDQAAKRAGSGPKVYRGDAEAFNVFDKARRGESTEAEAAYEGFFFTSAPAAATMFRDLAVGKHQKPGHPKSKDPARKGGAVRSFYLQTKNPKIIDQGKRKKLPIVSLHDSHRLRRKGDIVQAREEGHDGVIFKNDYDLTEADNYVVFEPEQIKSADPFTYDDQGNLIPLSERFDTKSDDIRRMPEDPTALPIVEARNEDGSVKKKDNKVVYETVDYDLLHAPALEQEAPPPQDTTKPDYDSLHYHVTKKDRERIDELIDSGAVDAAAADLEADAMQAMDIPEIASGIGWYSRMRKKLRIALAGDHALFADLLGATSANTDVEQNFIYAFDAYRQFKAGKFDKMLKRFQEAVDLADSDKLKETMIARRIIGKRQAKRMDQQALLKKWIERYKLEPRRADGAKYGMNSAHVFRALSGQFTQVRGPRAKDKLSPKTPQFSMNLFGSSLSATIDVWAARYLRRRLYSGQVKQWRIQPKSETGVSNGDFLLGQEIFRRAADKLGLSPDDLQALMWFMEKDVWDQAGWTKGAGAIKTSFDQAADAFFPPKQKMSASQLAQANRRGLSSLNFIRKHRAVENAATRLEALAGQTGRKVTTAKRNLRNARKELTKARKRAGVAEFLERNPELN
tara:strand:- start:6976 stop:13851 length:6876 start_codon:yes stop_codon:yes gene_type:complete